MLWKRSPSVQKLLWNSSHFTKTCYICMWVTQRMKPELSPFPIAGHVPRARPAMLQLCELPELCWMEQECRWFQIKLCFLHLIFLEQRRRDHKCTTLCQFGFWEENSRLSRKFSHCYLPSWMSNTAFFSCAQSSKQQKLDIWFFFNCLLVYL